MNEQRFRYTAELDDEILTHLAEAAVGADEGHGNNNATRASKVEAARSHLASKKRELAKSLASAHKKPKK